MRKQLGFTLAEIAIVLVIVIFLLGGIIKGRELIVQAKIKNTIDDYNKIVAMFEMYRERYRALPGDDSNAGARWAGGVAGNGNMFVDGSWNSQIPTDESLQFWAHLRQSGLLVDGQPTVSPFMNSGGGETGVQTSANILGISGTLICMVLPAKIAIGFDSRVDDGKPNGGTVRAVKGSYATTLTTTPATEYVEDSDTYVVCSAMSERKQ